MKKYLFVSLILSFSIVIISFAQEETNLFPARYSIGLSAGETPQKQSIDGNYVYQSKWWDVHGGIPIWKSIQSGEDKNFQQMTLFGNIRRTTVTTTLPSLDEAMTNASFGGSYMVVNDKKELYLLSPSIRVADADGISLQHPRFTLTGIGTHHFSESWLFIYGINYSSVFARELLLPILGGQWKIDDQWSATAILPFSLAVNYRYDETLHWKFHIGAAGDRIYFNNNNSYANASSTLLFRSTVVKMTAQLDTKISQSVRMNIEAGILGARKLWISDGDTNITATTLKPSSYFSIGFRFLLDFSDDEEFI